MLALIDEMNASVLYWLQAQYKDTPPAAKSARIRFLKKPFFPSQLVALLREML